MSRRGAGRRGADGPPPPPSGATRGRIGGGGGLQTISTSHSAVLSLLSCVLLLTCFASVAISWRVPAMAKHGRPFVVIPAVRVYISCRGGCASGGRGRRANVSWVPTQITAKACATNGLLATPATHTSASCEFMCRRLLLRKRHYHHRHHNMWCRKGARRMPQLQALLSSHAA